MEDRFIALYDDAFDRIGEAIKQAVDRFNAAVRHVHDKLFLPGPALHWIQRDLARIRDGLTKLVQFVSYAFQHHLPVLSLIRQSFDWIEKVRTPMSELSFPATDPVDQRLWEWTGGAATAYWKKAGQQQAAIDDVSAKAKFISKWLFTIAETNVNFVVQLAKVVADLVGKIVQAAIETATVVDIPFAVNTLAGEAGTLVTEGINTLLEIGRRFVNALGNVRDIASEVGDRRSLPGRRPSAVDTASSLNEY